MRGPGSVFFLALLLLVMPVFAGCLSSDSTPTVPATISTLEPKPTGKLNQSKIPLPDGANPDLGAIRGDITSIRGGVIKNARVLILGSERQTQSSTVGAYAFNDVPEGEYTLRVEAKEYLAAEDPITVEKGWLTLANVSIEPEDPNNMVHVHDYWFENGLPVLKRTLFNRTLEYPTSLVSGGERAAPSAGCVKYTNPVNGQTTTPGACFDIPFWLEGEGPQEGIVWPGTNKLDVTVQWSDPQGYVPIVKLQYQPANVSNKYFDVVLGSGETKSITVQPQVKADGKIVEMTDSGHARWTKWRFKLHVEFKVAENVYFNSGDLIRSQVGPFRVSIVAHKGVLPVEPTHPRPWLNGDTIIVVQNLTKRVGDGGNLGEGVGHGLFEGIGDTNGADQPPVTTHNRNASREPDDIGFFLPTNKIIPAGTTKLKVTLTYGDTIYNETDLPQHRRSLSFRTASVHPARATMADMKTPPHNVTDGRAEWFFKLADPKGNDGRDDETDPVYSVKSGWKFILANEGEERDTTYVNYCSGACGGTYFWLTVIAINEHWQEEFDAGLI